MDEREERKFKKQNEAVYNFVRSEHWDTFRNVVFEEINDLQSIMNITGSNELEVFLDIKVRKNLVELLTEFVKKFEGQARQYEINELSTGEHELSFIERDTE